MCEEGRGGSVSVLTEGFGYTPGSLRLAPRNRGGVGSPETRDQALWVRAGYKAAPGGLREGSGCGGGMRGV